MEKPLKNLIDCVKAIREIPVVLHEIETTPNEYLRPIKTFHPKLGIGLLEAKNLAEAIMAVGEQRYAERESKIQELHREVARLDDENWKLKNQISEIYHAAFPGKE